MEAHIHGPVAAAQVVQAYKRVSVSRSTPWPRERAEWDRHIKTLFEDGTELTPADVAARMGAIIDLPGRNDFGGTLMRWAVREGIVGRTTVDGHPHWTLLLPGVVFVPRDPDCLDIRVPTRTGGLPLDTLAAREAKLRVRLTRERREYLKDLIYYRLEQVDGDLAVPHELRTSDHPPVKTMEEFRANLPGFIDHMPFWKVGELCILACVLPWKSRFHDPDLESMAILGALQF
jgi:hypothetical protein